MKICIFGAGAIGGLLAVRMANAGYEVSVVARGPHLAAIKENGLKLRMDGEEYVAKIAASDNAADLGPQDYVFTTLKAHSLPPVVDKMAPLFGPDTCFVTAMNGVPYWYFHGIEGHEGRIVEAVDPGGVVLQGHRSVAGAGLRGLSGREVSEPGVIEHEYGDRFPLGEPDGSKSERALALSEAMKASGFKAPVRPRIRDDIWVKLWGNLAFNPALCADPSGRWTCWRLRTTCAPSPAR